MGAEGNCSRTQLPMRAINISADTRAELRAIIPRLAGSKAKGEEFASFGAWVSDECLAPAATWDAARYAEAGACYASLRAGVGDAVAQQLGELHAERLEEDRRARRDARRGRGPGGRGRGWQEA